MFAVFCARGLAAPCSRAWSWSGRRWLSLFAGGELLFAWFRRSSAARSLASRASSSLVWVVTASFLRGSQSALQGGEGARGKGLLFKHSLVEVLNAAVQVEQAVELRHEVARYGAAGEVRIGRRELC